MQLTLVIGASGFLGTHVVASAVDRARAEATFADPNGPPVVGACRHPDRAPRFSTPRDAAEWLATDLAAPGAAERLLETLQPARVVNCAALARVGDCEARPDAARRRNTEVPGEVALWCQREGARLVHVSTDLVFGAQDAPPGGFGEDAEVGPLSVYGRSKADGERAVLDACPAALVVRLPLLYGNSGGRGLGASDSLLEAVERDALPPLFVDEWRAPLEVGNAADALVELAHGELSGLLHVAGPDRVSRYELGLAVLAAMGVEREAATAMVRTASVSEVETAAPRPRDVSLDARVARRRLEVRLLGVADGTRKSVR